MSDSITKEKARSLIFLTAFLMVHASNYFALAESEENQEADLLKSAREAMVKNQLEARGIQDPRILEAMRKVKRHRFVPPALALFAYGDNPLPIGQGQTISQPYIVAFMTQAILPKPEDRILEIGTGSGYQAAVLAEIVKDVYSIEIVPELAKKAKKRLQNLGYDNVLVKYGDGYKGWPDEAPFDAIVITAAPETIPEALVEQLKNGGRMIVPVGKENQELLLITKTAEGIVQERLFPVRFVPMVKAESE